MYKFLFTVAIFLSTTMPLQCEEENMLLDQIAKALLVAKANPNLQNSAGYAPLRYAKRDSLKAMLLEHGSYEYADATWQKCVVS
jgi:hypothetical protein